MSDDRPGHAGPGLWIGLALGVPIMAWGARGILLDDRRTHPAELARWIVGSAVVHDALVLPAVLLLGVLARRAVAARAWPPIRWALMTTAVVAVVSWPFVRGYGHQADNPSLLPRNYGAGVLVALGVVWVMAGALAVRPPRRSTPAVD